MTPRTLVAAAALVLVTAVAACDTGDGKTLREPTAEQRANVPTTTTTTTTLVAPPSDIAGGVFATTVPPFVATFALTTPWASGGPIDARYTCDGEDRSPLLTWTAPPAGTVELALTLTDDNAPDYVHWVVAGIPPAAGEKGEGGTITGAVEGENSGGTIGWRGPCPPSGETHTYRLTMYALDQQAELPDGFTGAELQAIAGSAVIGITEVTGTYTRAS